MQYKILYVEDEHILGQLVTESLRKLGYDMLQVTNGVIALGSYRSFMPHLCLLDVMLPGKDGYEIAKQLRTIDKNIPIIFLTAKVQTSDLIAGFDAGCNDYIRKPFSMDELALRIANWLNEKYGDPDVMELEEYVIDEFRFLPRQQKLIKKGNVIQLTHKEALILAMLYHHRNRIVNRAGILQKVWGNDSSYNSRTLDVYVNRLRKYFDNDPNRIITLKGVGYRFICKD